MRKIIILSFGIIISGFLFYSSAFADNVDYTVNIAPSLNVSVSSNNVVLDLNPNTKTSDSKDITVTVGTNNITGYKLNMSTTGDITSLTRDSSLDGINDTIPTLSSAAGTTANSLTDNTWGYRLNNTGNFIPYVSGVQIMEKNIATNADTATLSFASKINYSQAAGSYNINLNFVGTVNPLCDTTITGYMQTFNPCPDMADGTTGLLIDTRDRQEYTVAKINGNFWMTQNIRFGLNESNPNTTTINLTPDSSNVVQDRTIIAYDLVTYGRSNCNVAGGGYDNPCMHTSSNNTIGVWYNYVAATAGTITGSSNTTEASEDICPKGWKLPTLTNIQDLVSAIGSSPGLFNPVYSGCYVDGDLRYTDAGVWFPTTASSGRDRYELAYQSGILKVMPGVWRRDGCHVRCIAK